MLVDESGLCNPMGKRLDKGRPPMSRPRILYPRVNNRLRRSLLEKVPTYFSVFLAFLWSNLMWFWKKWRPNGSQQSFQVKKGLAVHINWSSQTWVWWWHCMIETIWFSFLCGLYVWKTTCAYVPLSAVWSRFRSTWWRFLSAKKLSKKEEKVLLLIPRRTAHRAPAKVSKTLRFGQEQASHS